MNNLNHALEADMTCPLAFAEASDAVVKEARHDALVEWSALDEFGPLSEGDAIERLHESGAWDDLAVRTSHSELLALYHETWVATLTDDEVAHEAWVSTLSDEEIADLEVGQ